MLGSSCYNILSSTIKLAVYLKVIPYKWNSHTFQFIHKSFKRKQFFMDLLILILCNLHFSFVLFKCVQSVIIHNASTSKLLLQFALGFPAGISCFIQLVLFTKKVEFITMVNNFIKLEKELTEKFEYNRKPNHIGIILWNLACLCCLHVVGTTLFFIAKPNTPIFIFPLFGWSKYWAIIWAPIEVFPYLFAWSSGLLFVNTCLPLMVSTKYWVRELG